MAAELEKLLKRVLQRILCLKRMLEILWHYFFKHSEHSIFVVASPEDPQKAPASHLTTSGPSAFKGPLGKCLNDSPTGHSFWTEDIVEFTPIEGGEVPELLDAELSVLSNDVQYLYKMLRLITIGSKVCLPRSADNPMGGYMTLRYANPGALHHARWVTLYSRGLCYYVSQKEPTRELVRDVTFAVHVYIPGWFLTIKRQSFVKALASSSRCSSAWPRRTSYWHPDDAKKKERRVVSDLGLMQRCLSDNAYFAHEENVLLGMLLDLERPDFRMKAAKTRVKCTSTGWVFT